MPHRLRLHTATRSYTALRLDAVWLVYTVALHLPGLPRCVWLFAVLAVRAVTGSLRGYVLVAFTFTFCCAFTLIWFTGLPRSLLVLWLPPHL